MEKTEKYSRGRHPNSRKNLKKIAGPGRPPLSPQEKVTRKEIRQFMREYLSNGEAIKDFERIRARKPEVVLGMSLDRVYGKTDKPSNEIKRGQVNILIQILTGKAPQIDDGLLNPSDNLIEDTER